MTSPETLGKQFDGAFKPFHPEVYGYDLSKVGMVPTHIVARYIQQDRTKDGFGQQSLDNIEALKKSISENGWTTAISMAHDKENNWGSIIEGNHRVAAALQLGLSHIPVQVHTMGHPGDGFLRTPRVGAPLHLTTTSPMPRFDYVHPSNFLELNV